ncbi:MAG TPA: hypothetical protein PLT31_08680 [Fibrobacteraceae bacterium]|nr:hypothetical protein [Fibrobacteraceae bacterium]
MNKNSSAFDFSINMDNILPELKKNLEERFYLTAQEQIRNRLRILCMGPKEIDRCKSLFSGKADPDLGMAYNQIQSAIDDVVLSANYKEMAKKYIEENFEKKLIEAMEKAMEHRANKMAFQTVKKWF